MAEPRVETHLSPYVKSLLTSVLNSPAVNSTQPPECENVLDEDSLINFENLARLYPPEEGERNADWYSKAVSNLSPVFRMCGLVCGNLRHNSTCLTADYCSWSVPQPIFENCINLLSKGDDLLTTSEIILSISPLLERGLGNVLFALDEGYKIPSLMRDILTQDPLTQVLGQSSITFLQILLGSPLSLNLRNLVWHGFPQPGEIPSSLAATLLLVVPSLGKILSRQPPSSPLTRIRGRTTLNVDRISIVYNQLRTRRRSSGCGRISCNTSCCTKKKNYFNYNASSPSSERIMKNSCSEGNADRSSSDSNLEHSRSHSRTENSFFHDLAKHSWSDSNSEHNCSENNSEPHCSASFCQHFETCSRVCLDLEIIRLAERSPHFPPGQLPVLVRILDRLATAQGGLLARPPDSFTNTSTSLSTPSSSQLNLAFDWWEGYLSLALSLPLLEAILRLIFVDVNGCPQRMITAEATSLYTTFTEMLEKNLDDGSENLLVNHLEESLLELLFDLLVLPDGVRLRDRVGHGEVDITPAPQLAGTSSVHENMDNGGKDRNIPQQQSISHIANVASRLVPGTTPEFSICTRVVLIIIRELLLLDNLPGRTCFKGESGANCEQLIAHCMHSEIANSSNNGQVHRNQRTDATPTINPRNEADTCPEEESVTNHEDSVADFSDGVTYHSLFHPSAQLARQLVCCGVREVMAFYQLGGVACPVSDTVQPLLADWDSPWLARQEVVSLSVEAAAAVVERACRAYRGQTLFRPKEEYEYLRLLELILENILSSCRNGCENVTKKRREMEEKTLRSRQRNTYRRMVSVLPLLLSALVSHLVLLTHLLLHKERLHIHRTVVSRLRKVLKCWENIGSVVALERNKWDVAEGHLINIQQLETSLVSSLREADLMN